MTFARRLAVLAGIVLPLGETARRWHQLADPRMFFAWFDDWLIGDPTGASRAVVVATKGAMLLLAIAALVSVLPWRAS